MRDIDRLGRTFSRIRIVKEKISEVLSVNPWAPKRKRKISQSKELYVWRLPENFLREVAGIPAFEVVYAVRGQFVSLIAIRAITGNGN